MANWTDERIAELSTDAVKILRVNAAKKAEQAIVDLCDAEIAKRAPVRVQKQRTAATTESRRGQVVIGFHFVCDREKGLKRNSDGTVWTGTWVVDKAHAERASTIGAYVALHELKAEPSYLQGTVKDWRSEKREREYAEGRPVQRETGVDFLLALTDRPYDWHGDGSGEKGYVWADSTAVSHESEPK